MPPALLLWLALSLLPPPMCFDLGLAIGGCKRHVVPVSRCEQLAYALCF